MKHFNKLTAAEAERLALLAEEFGEAIQVIGKILRHGYESGHPDSWGPNGPLETNRDLLNAELGDITCAIEMMLDAGDINNLDIATAALRKEERLKEFLHHQIVTD